MKYPPITSRALSWLENYIKSHMIVFEYCSGNSTHFFRNSTHLVISIEYLSNNFYKLDKELISIPHHILKLIEPISDPKSYPYSHESYGSTDTTFLYHNFKNYVKSIKKYENNYFDIVFISGRARASCIMTAVPKIKKEGILILNDSERYIYQDAIKLYLNNYTTITFEGNNKKTSIYKIK